MEVTAHTYCSGAFIVKGEKFLFGKRQESKSWYPGKWDIFGGHSFAGEHPFDTLKRELLEELGIRVVKARLIATLDVPHSDSEKIAYYIYVVYGWHGAPTNCGVEHSEIKWFTRAELNSVSLAAPEYLNLINNLAF